MNYEIREVHISDICWGDTVIHGGEMRTVGKKDIRYSSGVGKVLFGDCYHCGYKMVQKVIIKRMTKNGWVIA